MLAPKFEDIGLARRRFPDDSRILESRQSIKTGALRDPGGPGYLPARQAPSRLAEGAEERHVAWRSENDIQWTEKERSARGLQGPRHMSIISLV